MPFCPQPEIDDSITLNNFFVMCRDIFGINTFEFEEDVYEPVVYEQEENVVYDENGHYDA